MYKQKYLKYKKKYLMSIKGGFVPDELTSSDEEEVSDIEEINEGVDEEVTEKIEEKILKEPEYVGDSNITTDKINKIVPIGKSVHGKIMNYDNFDSEEYTTVIFTDIETPIKNKILKIDNKESFDKFTDKYGFIKKKTLMIDWLIVEKHYRGIYVSSSIENRVDEATYLNKVMISWVTYEYKYIDDVIIFIKEENIKYEKEINSPFKGYIMDHYAIDEHTFVTINEEIVHDKIVVINSIKHFDQFTNKYGNGDNIAWDKVKVDYIGLYLGDDKDLDANRREKCFFNSKLVNSWWGKGKLESGLVYMFK